MRPEYPEALNNLGNALEANGDISQAIAAYRQAIALKSDNADYRKNLGMALLAAGKFDEGWPEYEWRRKTKQFADARIDTAKPQWRGEEAKGRVLLIRSEQGFGNSIQFCRYAPLAASRGFQVVLEVQPALTRLMETLTGVKRVISQGEDLPDHDFFCPMMSLPTALRNKTRYDSRAGSLSKSFQQKRGHLEKTLDRWGQRRFKGRAGLGRQAAFSIARFNRR